MTVESFQQQRHTPHVPAPQSRINNLEAEEGLRRTMMGSLRGQLEATQAENKRLQSRIGQLEAEHKVRVWT